MYEPYIYEHEIKTTGWDLYQAAPYLDLIDFGIVFTAIWLFSSTLHSSAHGLNHSQGPGLEGGTKLRDFTKWTAHST